MKKLIRPNKNLLKILMSLTLLLSSTKGFGQGEIYLNQEEIQTLIETVELCDKIVNKCDETIQDAKTTIQLQEVKIEKLEREKDRRMPWYFWVITGGLIGTQIGR